MILLANANPTLAFYNFKDDVLPLIIVVGTLCVLWVLWKEFLRQRRR